jgi:hypothetical protein
MEPLKPIGQISEKSNTSKIILVIVLLIIAIGGLLMLKKSEAPVKIEEQPQTIEQSDSQQIGDEIDSATTFDNESSLKEIDKEF